MNRFSSWLLGVAVVAAPLALPSVARAQGDGVDVAPTTSGVAPATSSTTGVYTARRGDTLETVARAFGVALDILRRTNPQLASALGVLLPGDRVQLPPFIPTGRTPPFVPSSLPTSSPITLPTPPFVPTTVSVPPITTPTVVPPTPVVPNAPVVVNTPVVPKPPTVTKPPTVKKPPTVAKSPSTTTTPTTDEPTEVQDPDALPSDEDTIGLQAIEAIKSGELKNPNTKDPNDWSKWCRALIRAAFRKVVGYDIPELAAGGTAWDSYLAFEKAGKIQKGGTPPAGAILFWSPQERARLAPGSAGARCGHVAIADGPGTCISNVKRGGKYDSTGRGIGHGVPTKVFGEIAGYVVMGK